jgi:hypothetical protein
MKQLKQKQLNKNWFKKFVQKQRVKSFKRNKTL